MKMAFHGGPMGGRTITAQTKPRLVTFPINGIDDGMGDGRARYAVYVPAPRPDSRIHDYRYIGIQ